MALSNIAVPKYYGKFRDAVIRGEIPVCREIEMEMYRIDDLIADPDIYYDDQAVEGFIKYCENELTLTDGSDLKLLDSFKVWAEQIFGWYEFEEERVYVPYDDGYGGRYVTKVKKKRLINKQYLIVARGAAKSMYGSCLQNFFLNVDVTTTHQITTAPTMKQAEEVLSPIRTAITRSRGPFYKFLTDGSLQNTTGSKANRMKLSSTKKGIENFLTGSLLEVRPMRIDKLQGLQLKMATVDEWLSGDIREDVIGAIEQGASKVEDYLIVAISSEGTVRNGAGDTIKMELMDILKGDYINPHVSIWWYKLDSVDEVGDPDKWIKANPNIGKTVSYETYQRDVDRAEKAPAARNDILAKRFGLPMEGYTYYFTYEETLPHRKREYWQMPCSLGADLSQGDDFCAFTFLFPLSNGSFGVKTRNYISSLTLMKLIPAMRTKYDQFIKEGSLIVLEGTVLDMMDVYEDLDNHIVEYLYNIDRMNLNEELATAIMLGDGRDDGDEGKIDPEHIRPIWTDDDLYTIHVDLDIAAAKKELQGTNTGANFGENYIIGEAMIDTSLYARESYKGTGTPDLFITPHMLNQMLLARDQNGRRIYSSKAELATALNVGSINTAEQFEGKTRTTSDHKKKKLVAIIANLADYSLGATKGGEITHFTQFDIDFNQEKSLLETRCSGALTRVYAAIVIEEDVTAGE